MMFFASASPLALCFPTRIYVFIYALGHFAVDAASVVVLARNNLGLSMESLLGFILLYNTLAFATQPFVGYLLDRFVSQKTNILLSLFILLAALTEIFPREVALVAAGLANSIFHVAAGAEILGKSHNKLWSLGAFVSTGALGLGVGALNKANPSVSLSIFVLLIFLAVLIAALPPLTIERLPRNRLASVPAWAIPALLFCISIRALHGFVQSNPSSDIPYASFILICFVFSGKFLGGFFSDLWTTRRVILFSIPAACLFSLMGKHAFWAFGVSQFCVNLSMPITLYLLYRCMPNRPGFAFGLAASFLLPGLFVSFLFPASAKTSVVFLGIFAVNLLLLYSVNALVENQKSLLKTET